MTGEEMEQAAGRAADDAVRQLRDRSVRRVLDAITDEGASPAYHRQQLVRLHRDWPALAAALAWQLRVEGRPVPAPWRGLQ